jgi:adenylyl cyclase-associated protein
MNYVKEYHTTGLVWNKNGVDTGAYDASAATAPVPGPAATTVKSTPAATSAAAPTPKADLFSALNKGGAITGGLKTVTKDMQTWRAEYKGAAEAPVAKAPVAPKPAAAQVALKGPPICEFQEGSSKWQVEYQTSSVDIAINDKKETVYVFGCVGATINIKGKCKSIVVDGCKKTAVHFDAAMASCEIVNSQRMQITVRDFVAAVAIDKTDGMPFFCFFFVQLTLTLPFSRNRRIFASNFDEH